MLVSNNSLLNILLPNDSKVLKDVLKEADTKTLNNIKAGNTSIEDILKDLFSDLKSGDKSKATIENMLKNSNLFKDLGNFTKSLDSLLSQIKADPSLAKYTPQLENFLKNISQIDNNSLKDLILKSGVFLESNINNSQQMNHQFSQQIEQKQTPLQNDIKSMLLQIQEQLVGKTDIKSADSLKQVDRMLMQIEYYQLLSITSNSNSVYIPFIWDMLDDGSISMKKLDEDKFYCEINLSLKEFGETQLLLSLYDKNKLDLTIYASKESFKQSIRENSIKLKQALNSVELIPVNINIIDLKNDEEKTKEEEQTNIYSQNINFNFGINIKV